MSGAVAMLTAYMLVLQALVVGFGCAATAAPGEGTPSAHVVCAQTDGQAAVRAGGGPAAPDEANGCACAVCCLGTHPAAVAPSLRTLIAVAGPGPDRLAPEGALALHRAKAAGIPGDARAPPFLSA